MNNKLTFIKYTRFVKTGPKYKRKALYQCECGKTTEAFEHNVKNNKTRSCGCYRKQNMIERWQKQAVRPTK